MPAAGDRSDRAREVAAREPIAHERAHGAGSGALAAARARRASRDTRATISRDGIAGHVEHGAIAADARRARVAARTPSPRSTRECSSRFRQLLSVATGNVYPAGSVSSTFGCFCTHRSRHVVTHAVERRREHAMLERHALRAGRRRRRRTPSPSHGATSDAISSAVSSTDAVMRRAPSRNSSAARVRVEAVHGVVGDDVASRRATAPRRARRARRATAGRARATSPARGRSSGRTIVGVRRRSATPASAQLARERA